VVNSLSQLHRTIKQKFLVKMLLLLGKMPSKRAYFPLQPKILTTPAVDGAQCDHFELDPVGNYNQMVTLSERNLQPI
jgi:hypothetical protein